MKPQTQLALLGALNRHRSTIQRGFTLVELLIVVAIIGILSAVALPQYLNARRAAQAGAVIGEGIGLAKECAASAASDIAASIVAGGGLITSAVVSQCIAGGTFTGSWSALGAGPAGLRCLNQTSVDTNSGVSILVGATGNITCQFTP